MSEEQELKPCPFCGNVAEIVKHEGRWGTVKGWEVCCQGPCELKIVTTGVYDGDVSRAVAAWNERDGQVDPDSAVQKQGREG